MMCEWNEMFSCYCCIIELANPDIIVILLKLVNRILVQNLSFDV